jgi:hypothetical protein
MAAEAPTAAGVEEVHILWISEGMSCDGDSVSVTAAGQPSIEDVLGRNPRIAEGARAQQGAVPHAWRRVRPEV